MKGPLGDDATVYVVARDPAKRRVLLGGLGALGVGEMWIDEEPRHRKYPGYRQAPKRNAPPRGNPW